MHDDGPSVTMSITPIPFPLNTTECFPRRTMAVKKESVVKQERAKSIEDSRIWGVKCGGIVRNVLIAVRLHLLSLLRLDSTEIELLSHTR